MTRRRPLVGMALSHLLELEDRGVDLDCSVALEHVTNSREGLLSNAHLTESSSKQSPQKEDTDVGEGGGEARNRWVHSDKTQRSSLARGTVSFSRTASCRVTGRLHQRSFDRREACPAVALTVTLPTYHTRSQGHMGVLPPCFCAQRQHGLRLYRRQHARGSSSQAKPHDSRPGCCCPTCSGRKSLAPLAIFGLRWAPPLLNRSAIAHKKGPIAR